MKCWQAIAYTVLFISIFEVYFKFSLSGQVLDCIKFRIGVYFYNHDIYKSINFSWKLSDMLNYKYKQYQKLMLFIYVIKISRLLLINIHSYYYNITSKTSNFSNK
jgi:hypothetical protein